MNLYVLVEGRIVEKEVFRVWIPRLNAALRFASLISDVDENNFVIVSGNGYPGYFDMIRAALEDVASDPRFARLVICIDSEDMTRDEKYDEVEAFIAGTGIVGVDYRIVVQHFCFETWALGNRRIGARNPKNPVLAGYRKLHDVNRLDPEHLPALPADGLNRSQFAEKYLRLTLNDKNKRLTYSKRNPRLVANGKYLDAVKARFDETPHIRSFERFIDAVTP